MMEVDSWRKISTALGFSITLPTELSLPLNTYLPFPWLVWSPGCHDKHLGGQFWDWSGDQEALINILAVSSGTGLVTRVPWQRFQHSVLGLAWTLGCHDKHLSGQFWDWSGHQGATINISAVSSLTDLVTMVPWQTSQRSVLGLVIRVPWWPSLQPVSWSAWSAWCHNHHLSSLEPSGSSSCLVLVTVAFPTSLSSSLSLTSK